jgi:hypothetical protein
MYTKTLTWQKKKVVTTFKCRLTKHQQGEFPKFPEINQLQPQPQQINRNYIITHFHSSPTQCDQQQGCFMKITDFWVVTPGSLADHCHHHSDSRLHGITPLKTVIFMVTVVRTTYFIEEIKSLLIVCTQKV